MNYLLRWRIYSYVCQAVGSLQKRPPPLTRSGTEWLASQSEIGKTYAICIYPAYDVQNA